MRRQCIYTTDTTVIFQDREWQILKLIYTDEQHLCFIFSLFTSWNSEHESDSLVLTLHLVPGRIIFCLFNPIMVIKDIIYAIHCQQPQVAKRLGEKRSRNIKHQIFSIICAWAQVFSLPTPFRRDPAEQNRPQNHYKALVGFQQSPEHIPVWQQQGQFICDYGLSVSLQLDFWICQQVSQGSEGVRFTYKRWEKKTLDSSKESDKSVVRFFNTAWEAHGDKTQQRLRDSWPSKYFKVSK